jgi:hypothetical protein
LKTIVFVTGCTDSETISKISECLARIVDLRQRANADANPAWKAELHNLELQWLDVLEGYKVVEQAGWFLKDIRAFPVATSSGKVLGSLAMYYKEPREATPRDNSRCYIRMSYPWHRA